MTPAPVRRRRLPFALLPTLAVVLALALSGCGSASSSDSGSAGGSGNGSAAATTSTTGGVEFAKTKFVLHAGLAFGAFHHFIWKPYRAGDFHHPFSHKFTLVKAGLAAAFVYHELGLALHDAQSSPTLSKLVSPITALQNRLHGVGGSLTSGNATGLASDNGSISQIESQAAQAGQSIVEQTPSNL